MKAKQWYKKINTIESLDKEIEQKETLEE